jgi:diguanylate cyclase (GGDEF)-like protein
MPQVSIQDAKHLNGPPPSEPERASQLASPIPLLQLIPDGAALALPGPWRLVFVNSVLAQWLGQPVEGLISWPIERVLGVAAGNELRRQLDFVWNGELDEATISAALLGSNSELGVPVQIRIAAVQVGQQKHIGLIIQNVPQRGTAPHGRRDPLTGLDDRSVLYSRLATLLSGDRSADQRFAVLFIDLDDFKKVNDRYGHLDGDRVLSEVARRLADCVRAGDQLVRFGGDEFVVLLEHVASWEEYWPAIARIQSAVAEPIAVSAGKIVLSASVGAAEVAPEHRTPEDVLAAADRAMYAAKHGRKPAAFV